MPCPTIVFCNHKGGVAKTTTTVAVGQILVKEFKIPKVLVIDCDSQGNASESLSPVDITNMNTLEECLVNPDNVRYCVKPSWIDGLDFIPSNTRLEAPLPSLLTSDKCNIEHIPIAYKTSTTAIFDIIKKVEGKYDIILIDTAPNLSPLTQSAIYAATHVVIPCSPTKHALFGMPVMHRTIESINPHAPVMVVITIHDRRTSYEAIACKQLEAGFRVVGDIPRNNRLSENISKHNYVLTKMNDGQKNALLEFCAFLVEETSGAVLQNKSSI